VSTGSADYCKLTGAVALYGGTFDPVQKAHIEIARRALSSFELSKVIFVPAKQNPLKESRPYASDKQRLDMLHLAVSDDDRFLISEYELAQPQAPSYTVNTARHFRGTLDSSCKLFFLCGSDVLPNLHRWKDLDLLFELLDGFLVIERSEFSLDQIATLNLSQKIREKLKTEQTIQSPIEITATKVRDLINNNRQEAKDLLPEEVYDYIQKHKLYLR